MTDPACPASPDALRDLIAEAFARRDANTLAGVLRWDGISGGAANARMRELAELTLRPLIGIELGGEAIEASLGDAPAPAPAMLVTVRTGGLARRRERARVPRERVRRLLLARLVTARW